MQRNEKIRIKVRFFPIIRHKIEEMIPFLKNFIFKSWIMCYNEYKKKGCEFMSFVDEKVYDAIDISKYVITKCSREECPISNLQLQKILYYIQKDFLKSNKRAFFNSIEAWQFGPVVPDVYYRFCGFGAMPIDTSYEFAQIDENDITQINRIVEEKRQLDPWDMVAETHKADGAWSKTYNNGLGNHHIIPIESIRKEK